MANETLEKMWNILKENEFHIDFDVKSEFSCISCKNIMVKACNVPCGCRYCHDCLISYLDNEERFCLGDSDDCKIELINIDKNVFIDQAVNIKISRIVVKCPQESCGFIGELRKMADHMRTCDRQPATCPYCTIGCEKNKIEFDKIKQHFKDENLSHSRLLMDFVENLRNEMKLLKSTMLDLQEENKWIKEKMESKQETILAMEESLSRLLLENRTLKELESEKCHQSKQLKSKEQNKEMETNKKRFDELEISQGQMRSKMESISKENTSLREELQIIKLDNKAKEEVISALKTKLEEEEEEIGKMKVKIELLEKSQEPMTRRIEELFLETKSLKDELETAEQDMTKQETVLSFQTRLEEQEQTIKRITEKTEDWKQKIDEECDQMENKQKQMATVIDKMTQENGRIKTRIDKITQENADTIKKFKESENAIQIFETRLTQIQASQNCGEFLWCIQNWEEKMERFRSGTDKFIFSDPFYSHRNGYKMCLRINSVNKGKNKVKKAHLSLFLCIMEGKFDNILQWPFRHNIKLELLNQKTGLPHVSDIVVPDRNPTSNSWKKPCSENNDGYGFSQFIELSEISSNAALCQGNQVWINAILQIKA